MRPDINIVCEKVAYEGVTRFEDRCTQSPVPVPQSFPALEVMDYRV